MHMKISHKKWDKKHLKFEKTKQFDYPIDKLAPYDVESIMHYDGTLRGHFSYPIMKDKKTNKGIKVNRQMSTLDIQKLNEMYPCNPGSSCGKLFNFSSTNFLHELKYLVITESFKIL